MECALVRSIEEDREALIDFRISTRDKLLELRVPSGVLEGVTTSALMRNKLLGYVEERFTAGEGEQFHFEVDKFSKSCELRCADFSRIVPDAFPALCRLEKLGC